MPIPGNSPGFFSQFAVHANMLGVNTGHGGRINIASTTSDVIASGNVAQANATPAGGDGGEVHIEASQNVTLDGANISAQGDINGTGGFGTGGQIGTTAAPIRAFNGPLSWATGIGDAQPTGSPLMGGASGVINLSGCGSVTATANFPATQGSFSPTISTACGGAPVLPSYVTLPSTCSVTCGPPQTGQITGFKWNDLNGNGVRDPGEIGLLGWQIVLFLGPLQVGTAFTDDTGSYSFPGLAAGTYDVCEVLQTGWTQTFPSSGLNCLARTLPGSPWGYTVDVPSGQTVSDINFGNRFPLPSSASKSGRKWDDRNGNGVQDPGEPNLQGWQIHLFLEGDPSFHQQIVTDANGNYSFTGIAPGAYRTCETLQPGWIQTFPTLVSTPPGEAVISCEGLPGVSGLGYGFLVTQGTETFQGNDFGNRQDPPTGQITGTKWNDLNGNGIQDAGEPGLLVWHIHLFMGGSEVANTFTGADGTYTFSNLADGTYQVCETLIAGWTQTFPTSGPSCQALTGSDIGHLVTIVGGQVVSGIDFGNRLVTPSAGVKKGKKWNDLNGNGVMDAGEPGLAGWQIHLFSNTDPSFHLQTTTDDNGDYSFTELAPGLYTACETVQSGWVQTAPAELLRALVSGDLVVDCSGLSGVSGLGYAFLIRSNETISGNDFGNRLSIVPPTGQIGGLKWNDLNGNGIRDAGEPGLAGWQIHLFNNADASFHQQATTGADGTYNFTGLAPGTYTVCETVQASWTQTAPTSGANCSSLTGVSGFGFALTLTANQSLQGNNFGNRQTIVPPTGQIGGLKWNDLNGNGTREADEPVLAGWQIHLFSNADASFHQQATTGADGTYNFTGLAPGAYTVCETVQVGWVQTAPTAVDCSGRDGVSGFGYALTLTENQSLPGNNFGNRLGNDFRAHALRVGHARAGAGANRDRIREIAPSASPLRSRAREGRRHRGGAIRREAGPHSKGRPYRSRCATSRSGLRCFLPRPTVRAGYPNGRIASTSRPAGMSSRGLTLVRPPKPTQFEPTPSAHAASNIDWIARLASETANRLLSVATTIASGACAT